MIPRFPINPISFFENRVRFAAFSNKFESANIVRFLGGPSYNLLMKKNILR